MPSRFLIGLKPSEVFNGLPSSCLLANLTRIDNPVSMTIVEANRNALSCGRTFCVLKQGRRLGERSRLMEREVARKSPLWSGSAGKMSGTPALVFKSIAHYVNTFRQKGTAPVVRCFIWPRAWVAGRQQRHAARDVRWKRVLLGLLPVYLHVFFNVGQSVRL